MREYFVSAASQKKKKKKEKKGKLLERTIQRLGQMTRARGRIKLKTLPGGIRHIVAGIKQKRDERGRAREKAAFRSQIRDTVMRPIRRKAEGRFQSVV